jgi:hypothetical protein
LKAPFWTSPELVTPERTYEYPDLSVGMNFPRSYYLRFEQIEVRKCLLRGLKCPPTMPWEETIAIHEILTETRRKNGVVYDQDVSYRKR